LQERTAAPPDVVVEGNENLRALGEKTLCEGAQDIVFDRA
jgi:hypothetical protein